MYVFRFSKLELNFDRGFIVSIVHRFWGLMFAVNDIVAISSL